MSLSKLSFPEQVAVDCDNCESHLNVNWYCLTCPANLCEKCKELHSSRKAFKKHRTIERDLYMKKQQTLKTETVKEVCISHFQNALMTCVTCGVLVCNECILGTHNGHTFENLRAKLERSKQNLSDYVEELTQKDNLILEQVKKNNEALGSVDIQTRDSQNEIAKARDSVIASVKAESERLFEEIECTLKSTKSEISASNSKLQTAHDKIQDYIKIALDKLGTGSPTTIDEFLNDAKEKDTLEINGGLKFSVPLFRVQAHHTSPEIGKLYFETRTVQNSFLNKSSLSDVKVIGSFHTTVKAAEMRAISSSRIWCGHFYEKTLKLYNMKGKEIESLSLTFFIQGFVLTKKGTLVVCDGNDKSIKQITQKGRVVTVCSTSPQQPWGICLNHKEQLIVCMKEALAIYSSDCKTKLQEFTHDQHGNSLFVWSYRVAMNDTDYCVADNEGKKVVAIDTEGMLKWTYTGGLGQKAFRPCNICCDSRLNVIIADTKNDKVHLLDRDGHFVMYITDTVLISRPLGLTVSDDGSLWIGEEHCLKKVHIVRYINNSLPWAYDAR